MSVEGVKMTVLVTGGGGQLGQELAHLKSSGVRLIALNREQLDITDAEQCREVISHHRPNAVIHAAAYTAVDRAETEPEAAWKINVEGTRNVAEASESVGAKLTYVSTDYVFNGTAVRPYAEYDTTSPRTVYGKTKLEGEKVASAIHSKLFITRTSWVYGRYGNNFVKTMLQLGAQGRELSVVADQIGSPTYTYDLATFLLELTKSDRYGTYHATGSGKCSWYEFAQAIFEEAGMHEVNVSPCTTEQYPRPASRPAYSVLGNDALIAAGLQPLRHWRDALKHFMEREREERG
ncbi:dTDP-4-dehydrorhamnose reductase [Cohnella soli]|uniref:dTDP-4-dehydrorhamnose reductase n=1 Tax=Cohnella soli TaxID=425005 RepID=A0ABW0HML1_9BACL